MPLPSILEDWLAKGEQLITPATRPSWLLNDFDDHTWLLKTRGQFTSRKGTWKGAGKMHWKLRVPGGDLCDDSYCRLLRHCKLLTISRAESPTSRSSALRAITLFHYYTLALAEFLIVHFPDEAALQGFRCITYSKIETFIGDYVRDGAPGPGHWIARWDNVVRRAYESADQRERVATWCEQRTSVELARLDECQRSICSWASGDPTPVATTLSFDMLRFARRWLACEGAFTADGLLRRAYIANAIEVDSARLRTGILRMRIHLRQFELAEDYRPFEHRIAPYREFLTRRFVSTEERTSRCPVRQRQMYVNTRELLRMSSHVDDLHDSDLPTIDLDARLPIELRGTDEIGRTPTVPAAIALKLLDQMIEWTLHRTIPLFDYFALLTREVVNLQGHARATERMVRTHPDSRRRRPDEPVWEQAFQRVPIPASLTDINLTQMCSARSLLARLARRSDGGSSVPARLRDFMTVVDAIELSVIMLICQISMLCARRISEVLHLPRDCLITRGGRYYLQFEVSKIHIDGVRARALRPVPAFLAKALRAQQRFAHFLVTTHSPTDPRIGGALFVVPSHVGCRRVISDFVYKNLDLLCDYFETARDDKGRRWYLRPHECRRFFALTFFHAHGQEASLPALSWMLGHNSLQHTRRYIKEQLTGSEISHSEATFAHAAITGDAASQAATQLRATVLKHFGAPRLELIDPQDVQALLELLHAQGRYRAEPCSIRTSDGYRHTILIHLTAR